MEKKYLVLIYGKTRSKNNFIIHYDKKEAIYIEQDLNMK